MIRTNKKLSGTLCAMLMLASAGVSVSAYPPILCEQSGSSIISPRYTNIDSISGSLIIRNGVAYIGGKIIPNDTMETKVICRLQKRESNGSWSTLTSCSGTSEGRVGAVATSSYYVDHGYYYRVDVTGYADGEKASFTTQAEYYQ